MGLSTLSLDIIAVCYAFVCILYASVCMHVSTECCVAWWSVLFAACPTSHTEAEKDSRRGGLSTEDIEEGN